MKKVLLLMTFALLMSCMSNNALYESKKATVVRTYCDTAMGSGVHLGDGYVLSAAHVVHGDMKLFHRDEEINGKIIKIDKESDLVLIYFKDYDGPSVRLAREELRVGDSLYTITYHFGQLFTFAEGIKGSYQGWKVLPKTYTAIIQSNPGSSGGPVFNSMGYLVGIVNAKYQTLTYYTGIKTIREFLDE